MTTTVSDYMNTNLITLESSDSAVDAARRMRESAVGDVLVMERGRLHGIVTDRDLVVRCLAESRNPEETPLADLCTAEPATLSPDDELDAAAQTMKDKGVRRLPVVSDKGVVGILSIGDLALIRDRESVLGCVSAAPPNQ